MRRPHRILVVDDHEDVNAMLVDSLDRRGHACLGVHSAEQALAALPAFRPEVILLEWNVEGGRRVDLARGLRECAASLGDSIMIVVVTAVELPENFEHIYIDACLMKPVPTDVIEQLMQQRPTIN